MTVVSLFSKLAEPYAINPTVLVKRYFGVRPEFCDFKFRATEAAKKTPANACICFIFHGYLCA